MQKHVADHITQRSDYDHAGRVLKTYHQINSNTEVLAAQYEYNALGQVVDKKLHNTGGTNFLQSVDYRYNIRGWLQSINNAQLSDDTGATNDEAGDYFGMELAYNSAAGMSNSYLYNGNISAMKWKTLGEAAGTAGQRSYKYDYDKSDKLKAATFQAYGASAWDKEANTLNESMSYDHGGNIVSLTRKKNSRGLSGQNVTSSASTIDDLSYTYTTNTNRISKVEDASTTEGFNNGAVNGSSEYTYTNDGSTNKDDNKGISSIVYNFLGKPQTVNYTSGKKVEYVYDAAGTKLTMKIWNGATLESATNYSGGFIYDGSTPAMSQFSSPEGRVVKNGSNFEYQYALADHQGNTRVVFAATTPAPYSITATFEGDSGDNANQFSNVNAGNVVTFTAANHTTGGSKVVRLNQNYKVGPSKSVRVYPGDKVDGEVWTYYENNSGFGTGAPTVAAMVTAVATAFGGVSGGGGESGSIYNGVNSALGGFGLGGNAGDTAPAAYLNYILYDQQYKVLDMGWIRVPTSAYFSKQKISLSQVSVKEAGYIFVYLSYEDLSNNYVQFDDFKVTHTKSNLLQGNEYYPFGMQTTTSWTRESNVANNFLYNGGTELNQTTQVYDLYYRNYDPVLGRFGQVDPMAGKYASMSPYNFSNDDPVFWNDPLGDDPEYDAIRIDSRIYSVLMSMLNNPYAGNPYLHGDDMPADPGRQSGGGGGSMFGGSWSPGGTELFESEDDAFSAGMEYNDLHNSWGSTIHTDGATAFNSYIERTVAYQMLFASLNPQTPAWSPVKLKDATIFDIARAFQYAHVMQTTATEEHPFYLNIYDLFDEEGAEIILEPGRHWEKEFLDRGIKAYIILPNNHKVGRIDTVLPYYTQKGGDQKGFEIDYKNVPTDSKGTKYAYGIGIYGANDSGANERLASLQFIPKLVDNFLGIRAFVFKNEKSMQLPTKVLKK